MESLEPDFHIPSQVEVRNDGFVKPTSKARLRFQGQSISMPSRRRSDVVESQSDGPGILESPRNGIKESLSWWIQRSTNLPACHRNGWVISLILEQYKNEADYVESLQKASFQDRMAQAGLQGLLSDGSTPRKRCAALAAATEERAELTTERSQRLMIKAIDRSIPSYVSGIRCWGAFCDALG